MSLYWEILVKTETADTVCACGFRFLEELVFT